MKRFFQLGIGFILIELLLIGFLSCGIYMLYGAILYNSWIMYTAGTAWSIFCLYIIITRGIHNVVFKDDVIFVPNDRLGSSARIQHRAVIPYTEIDVIRIVVSCNDSKDKPIVAWASSSNAPKSYFEFTLKNGDIYRVFIMYFSNKQRKEMLNIINKKAGTNFDYDKMATEYRNQYLKK